jgi:hypothetical protein
MTSLYQSVTVPGAVAGCLATRCTTTIMITSTVAGWDSPKVSVSASWVKYDGAGIADDVAGTVLAACRKSWTNSSRTSSIPRRAYGRRTS